VLDKFALGLVALPLKVAAATSRERTERQGAAPRADLIAGRATRITVAVAAAAAAEGAATTAAAATTTAAKTTATAAAAAASAETATAAAATAITAATAKVWTFLE
jgi:hypothetical protein